MFIDFIVTSELLLSRGCFQQNSLSLNIHEQKEMHGLLRNPILVFNTCDIIVILWLKFLLRMEAECCWSSLFLMKPSLASLFPRGVFMKNQMFFKMHSISFYCIIGLFSLTSLWYDFFSLQHFLNMFKMQSFKYLTF